MIRNDANLIKIEHKVISSCIFKNDLSFLDRYKYVFLDELSKRVIDFLNIFNQTGQSFDGEMVMSMLESDGEKYGLTFVEFNEVVSQTADPSNFNGLFHIIAIDYYKQRAVEIMESVKAGEYKTLDEMQQVYSSLLEDDIFYYSSDVQTPKDLLPSIIQRGPVEKLQGVIDFFDERSGGIRQNRFIVIASRPGGGKTSYINSRIVNCLKVGLSVGMITLEIKADEMLETIACMAAKVNFGRYEEQMMSAREKEKMYRAMEWLHKQPLLINDSKRKFSEIKYLIEFDMIKKNKVDIIFIDYLQLISNHKPGMQEREKIADMTKTIKRLCNEYNVPIVVLAQMGRQADTDGDRQPRLSDLKGSGDIEQDADIVIFLHPFKVLSEEESVIDIIIRKNRKGPVGAMRRLWKKDINHWSIPTNSIEYNKGGV
jgi:replicative DNA helicase